MAKIENTIECIEKLMKKMNENGMTSLQISNDDIDIKLEKAVAPVYAAPVANYAAAPVAATTEATPAKAIVGNVVKSPIVGTFYNSPAPDKAAFVSVGQKVKKGDVLLIVESMKLMNEITSEFDGTVAEIYVETSSAVEYDQPLMRIE